MHHGTCVTHVPWCMPGSLMHHSITHTSSKYHDLNHEYMSLRFNIMFIKGKWKGVTKAQGDNFKGYGNVKINAKYIPFGCFKMSRRGRQSHEIHFHKRGPMRGESTDMGDFSEHRHIHPCGFKCIGGGIIKIYWHTYVISQYWNYTQAVATLPRGRQCPIYL